MKKNVLAIILVLNYVFAFGQAPAGYYSNANSKACATLKTALKTIITTGHNSQTYGDLWTRYEISDIKLREVGTGSANVIWDIYSDNPSGTDPYNFTPGTGTGGQQDQGSGGGSEGQFYNREHTVPLSWFSGSTGTPGPATDYMHLFPTDKKVNGLRANFIYGEVSTASTTTLNGSKLGTAATAGLTGTVFEPINAYKGDVARAFLYFVTRYENDIPGWSSNAEATQSFDNSTFPSVKINYLKLMIKWHNQDPVSQKEIDRNNAAYAYQGNRNPYVDHPEYVNLVWNNTCPGLSSLPVNIIYFTGKLQGDKVLLNWQAENEINFDKYEIERSFNGTAYTKIGEIKAANLSTYSFNDNADAIRGRAVYYRLKKSDKDGSFSYSAIFKLHIPLNTKFTVYPNPSSGSFINLQLNNNLNDKVTVQITDMAGRIVINHIYTANTGLISIPTTKLSNGTFLVKMVTGENETFIQKVVVIK